MKISYSNKISIDFDTINQRIIIKAEDPEYFKEMLHTFLESISTDLKRSNMVKLRKFDFIEEILNKLSSMLGTNEFKTKFGQIVYKRFVNEVNKKN